MCTLRSCKSLINPNFTAATSENGIIIIIIIIM